MRQRTLVREYKFEGKGLHTGRFAHVILCPAPAGTGVRFQRTDLSVADPFVEALAENVSSTRRSTTLRKGKVKVQTVEHVLSALTGLGVDNALIKIDSPEMPILDGSARLYVEAIAADPLQEQDAERKWLTLSEPVVVEGGNGAYVRIEPADDFRAEATIDFGSKVLGVQTFGWDFSADYASEVAPCRTFCFLHEIRKMLLFGLVKGGDLDNAIVVVEKPVSGRELSRMAKFFGQPKVEVSPDGYLCNAPLRFPDECCRHKMLDLLGDLRLAGGFFKARVTAFKPGHGLNTKAALALKSKLD